MRDYILEPYDEAGPDAARSFVRRDKVVYGVFVTVTQEVWGSSCAQVLAYVLIVHSRPRFKMTSRGSWRVTTPLYVCAVVY